MTLLGSSYPLLDVFLTTLWIVGFLLWLFLVIGVLADVFRSGDLSGWGKAGWTFLIVVLPLLGVLIYLAARGHKMLVQAEEEHAAEELATAEYVGGAAGSGGPADEVAKPVDLRDPAPPPAAAPTAGHTRQTGVT